ncbi:ROK family protein [Streptosporangium canum]|uniref:ROK family protein n=1 Tax=Streptosporangium canum TaxID=324952 RepID=UPI00339F2D9E
MRPVAAIDIGGTKIAGALVSAGGRISHRLHLPTPASTGHSAEDVMAVVARIVRELASAEPGARGVGIGSAGPIDLAAGTVSPVNIPAWRDFPLLARVTALSGGLPVTLIGDGAAMAYGEHRLGAARGCADALCMVVSTGIGGALILHDAVHPGPSGNAGHIGHVGVDLDGERCTCGSRGCVETIASGPAITRWALANGWTPSRPPAVPVDARAVARAAAGGDPVALAAFGRAARALAAAIASTAALTDVRVVVIGGGVARAGPVLFDPLRTALREQATLPFLHAIDVRPALLGADAGLVGAAAAVHDLWESEHL